MKCRKGFNNVLSYLKAKISKAKNLSLRGEEEVD